MTRNAKNVALHDLSFWHQLLPALPNLYRILGDYEVEFGPGFFGSSDAETLALASDLALSVLPSCWPVTPNQVDRRTMLLERAASDHDGQTIAHLAGKILDSLLAFGGRLSLRSTPSTELRLAGSGVVSSGSIDVFWDDVLVEMKATRRSSFNAREVRQVLMYAGLVVASRQETPVRGAVLNPRLGSALVFDLDELLGMCGGLTLVEFADELAEYLARISASG